MAQPSLVNAIYRHRPPSGVTLILKHDNALGNMLDGMYDWLAKHLMVSVQALQDLQVGYVPVVKFKGDKPSYDGWFSIPMRDATGKVTGLALRNQDDKKFLYPGSKPACFFVVNPKHSNGEKGYSNGASNWVRTMDAGILCPVCGKPDGCLLSAENPSDPKAVICRVKKSNKPQRFGYLHIRKADGLLGTEPVLGGEGVVLVVEGMSDVAAAADLGFIAVGRPGNVQGQDIVADLVRGRSAVVVGENDVKSDGRFPGRDGMIATFTTVKKSTRDCRMVMPPSFVKDLRAWKNRHGLTLEGITQYVAEHGMDALPDDVLVNNEPRTVARAFVKKRQATLIRWAGNFYSQQPGQPKYQGMEDESLNAEFRRFSADMEYLRPTKAGDVTERLIATRSSTADWTEALVEFVHLPASLSPPTFINGGDGPAPQDLVIFKNCMVDVSGYANGQEYRVLDPTPDLFTLSAIPYDFVPNAKCPGWLKFLSTTLGVPDKVALLQEFFGVCLVPDTRHQKFLYAVGDTGSGKGVTKDALISMLGVENVHSSTVRDFSDPFGREPVIGKRLTIFPDARLHGDNAVTFLELLLQCTGQDAPGVNRKFKTHAPGQAINCQWMFASNKILRIDDTAEAVARRVMLLRFNQNFQANPDAQLRDKHADERQGIAVWALEGLKRLRQNRGRFTVPESSKEAMNDWKLETNPARAFVDECCVLTPDAKLGKDQLLDAARNWNMAQKSGNSDWCRGRNSFRDAIKTATSGVVRFSASKETPVTYTFAGITLTPDAFRSLLGRPGVGK